MLDIKEDERFERQGDDLYYDLPLSFSQAALGGTFTVPTPYGDEEVKIPPGPRPRRCSAFAAGDCPCWARTARAIC